jgi:regulator of protease activity HflC (stomatin/prohibitin superfamily)
MYSNNQIKLKIKNIFKLFLVLFLGYFLLFDSLVYINPGHVGIFINRFTGKVKTEPLTTGYQLKLPFITEIIEYPYHMQTLILTQDIREGSPTNEEIITNSIEGQQISFDISISYTLDPNKVPFFYISFRKSLEEVNHSFVRNTIRQVIQEVTGKITVIDIMGAKKLFLITSVENILKERLSTYGFIIKQFTLNQLRAPKEITKAIEQKSIMIQETLEAQNQLLKVKYESQQKVEKAKGKAKGILNVAESQAEANKLITTSINKTLIKYKAIEKWDGKLPSISE